MLMRVSFTRFEVKVARRRSSEFATQVLQVSGEKQPGRHSLREIGDSLSPAVCGWREVSRASATGDVVHAREKSYVAYAESNRAFTGLPRSIRTLRHWRIPA